MPRQRPVWADQDALQRTDTLREGLEDFINFFNKSVSQRNAERARIIKRLDAMEVALKEIESRVEKLEKKKPISLPSS